MSQPHVKVSLGKGRYRIEAEAHCIGKDIIVSIWGGTAPHIGSVAAAVPRPSLEDPVKKSATSSVINFVGHKDDTVARLFSEKIAAHFEANCVAAAGIHLDNATQKDIELVLKNCRILCSQLLKKLETCV
jgi:hypothetical protein